MMKQYDWLMSTPRELAQKAATVFRSPSEDHPTFKMAANNPRKFEEKIAQHKLRQAQETKEFEKIMEEMSFVNAIKSQTQNQRQSRGRYGGSLPDFSMAQTQSNRHEQLSDMANMRHSTDMQSQLKDRSYPRNRHLLPSTGPRRHNLDSTTPCHFSPYLSPPQIDAHWRRTSSDSSIYHTLSNPNMRQDVRKMSTSPDNTEVGSYLAPKGNEMPDIKLCTNNQQQQQQQQPTYNYQPTNGSLPDLANLHIPSPLSSSIDNDDQYKQNYPSSTNSANAFMRQGVPRRNTTGSSCKKQLYHRHQQPQMTNNEVIQQQPPPSYIYQQQQPVGSPSPTSPTCASSLYPTAPMSPLANSSAYVQYQNSMLPNNIVQQQLEQMATIAENLRPMNVSNGQMIQGGGIPPQSPNTFLTNMLSQNPVAMEIVRGRFHDAIFGGNTAEATDANPTQMGNSLAQDIGDAIGGYDLNPYRQLNQDLPAGMSLAPLNIEDIEVLTGGSGVVADEAVEAEFRREGQQQLM